MYIHVAMMTHVLVLVCSPLECSITSLFGDSVSPENPLQDLCSLKAWHIAFVAPTVLLITSRVPINKKQFDQPMR